VNRTTSVPMMTRTKKSPIKRPALRDAGASIQKRFNLLLYERIFFWVVGGALFVGAAISEWLRYYKTVPPNPWLVTGLASVACIIVAIKVVPMIKELRRLQIGLSGEKAVAEKLDELKAKGYQIIHDIPGDGFNVDHVVVGPTGVFVIETKMRSKVDRESPGSTDVAGPDQRVEYDGKTIRVDGFEPDRDPIKQVQALADFIRKLIKDKIGLDIAVRPVVVFPGWWVNEPRPTPPIWVLNDTRLLGYIRNERNELSPERIRTVSTALKDHVRDKVVH